MSINSLLTYLNVQTTRTRTRTRSVLHKLLFFNFLELFAETHHLLKELLYPMLLSLLVANYFIVHRITRAVHSEYEEGQTISKVEI